MAGRPNNSIDLDLARRADALRMTREISIRAFAASIQTSKSTADRFLKQGIVPRDRKDAIQQFVRAIDTGEAPQIRKTPPQREAELTGQLLFLSRKMVNLLSELDAKMRNRD